MYTDFELAAVQADVLYLHDAGGRLLRVNEGEDSDPAPRFFLSRTSGGNLWRTRYDLPTTLTTALERLAQDEQIVSDLREPPQHAAEYNRLLEQHAPVSSTYAGPAYYLPELEPPTRAVTITQENAALLQTYYPYTQGRLTERAPIAAVVEDGLAVAICFSARSNTQVAEAGVDTVEAYRGRGFAAEVVRGWAATLRTAGKLPLYSTWWANHASQRVAHKLGAIIYGVEFSIS